MNSHLLPPFISYRSSGEKLIKYQANSSYVIMSVILMTTLFYKALILQGEIWCWSLLGVKQDLISKLIVAVCTTLFRVNKKFLVTKTYTYRNLKSTCTLSSPAKRGCVSPDLLPEETPDLR